RSGHAEHVAAIGDLDAEPQLDLAQMPIEGSAQVGEALDIGRVEGEVALGLGAHRRRRVAHPVITACPRRHRSGRIRALIDQAINIVGMDSKPPRKRPGTTGRPAQRAPGRPPDDADRRALALDAALACDVRRGIAATTLRDIADEAGVTPSLLHYYFGDAAGLREAVTAERLMPVFIEIRDLLLGMPDAPLREVLTAFVDALCDMVRRYAWLPALWIREVVSEGGSLRDLLVQRLAPQIAGVLAGRFAQEQAAGRL